MRMLIPYFAINGFTTYPDHYELFSGMKDVMYNEIHYWDVDYIGVMDLAAEGVDYQAYLDSLTEEKPVVEKVEIKVLAINDDNDDSIITSVDENRTVAEIDECCIVRVKSLIDVPDRNFTIIMRRDDGRLILFPVEVKDGTCDFELDFPTSGIYTFDTALANHVYPEKPFVVKKIVVEVRRVTGSVLKVDVV